MARSRPAVAKRLPSGWNATANPSSVCPVKTSRHSPVATSQTRTVRSVPAEASRRPSGLKAMAWMSLLWPDNSCDRWYVRVSHITTIDGSSPLPASHLPSGLKATPPALSEKTVLPVATSVTVMTILGSASLYTDVTILAPSGLTARKRKYVPGVRITLQILAVATSQICSRPPSSEPTASQVVPGMKARVRTVTFRFVLATRSLPPQGSPVSASQMRTVPSQLPDAIHRASGLYATG